MRRLFLALVNFAIASYVRCYGVDAEDRKSILMHLDNNAARKLHLTIEPKTAADYLAYLESKPDTYSPHFPVF